MLYRFYRFITHFSAPVLDRLLQKRLAAGKEDAKRIDERRGVASIVRPTGKVMWVHGASVGEAISVLPLLKELQQRLPGWHFLMTTGTVTSARLMAERLPQGVIHQFIPMDHPRWVVRFMDHWRPDAVIWLESELWPNLLNEIRQRRIPAGLLNARMRVKSRKKWQKIPKLAKQLFGTFRFILSGSQEAIPIFQTLSGCQVDYLGSLKFGASPLPFDKQKIADLQNLIGGRPCIGFLSTHADEESFFGNVIKSLQQTMPELLGIIAPRKVARGREIAAMLGVQGFKVALRSQNENITSDTQIYVTDTIGEMGLWYTLCHIVVIGGSFIPFGGQNPLEAAHFDCAILYGPSMENFTAITDVMEPSGAAQRMGSRETLLPVLQKILAKPVELQERQAAAKNIILQNNGVIEKTADYVIKHLVQNESA